MKKLGLALVASAGLLVACQNSKSNSEGIIIEGQVNKDIENFDAKRDFVYLLDESGKTIDSLHIEDNHFRFVRPEGDSLSYAIVRLGQIYTVPTFVEPGKIQIDFLKEWASGTPLNDKMTKFYQSYNELSQQTRNKIDSLYNAGHNQELLDSLISASVYNLQGQIGQIAEGILREHPNDALGVRMMLELLMLEHATSEDAEAWRKLAGEYVLNHKEVAQRLKRFEAKKTTAVGQKFVDFTGQTAEGADIKLSQYVAQGHYTLVDFWASWCGPCRAEFKHLKEVYKKYKPLGLEIVGIAISDKVEDHKKAVREDGITWPQIISEKEAATLYGVNSIPHLMLIDPQGQIVARGLRGEEVDQELDKALKTNGGKL